MKKFFSRIPKKALAAVTAAILLLPLTGIGQPVSAYAPYHPEWLYGDVDQNGKIDTVDARMILQSIVGKIELDPTPQRLADVDDSNQVDTIDARYILQYIVQKITYEDFPIVKNNPTPPEPDQLVPVNEDPYTGNAYLPDSPQAGTSFLDISEVPDNPATGTSARQIGRMVFSVADNPGLPFNIACNVVTNTASATSGNYITALLPAGVDCSSLVPEFTTYGKQVATLNGDVLTSGVTPIDLSNGSLTLVVTSSATRPSTRDYIVDIETLADGIPSMAVTTDGLQWIDHGVYIPTRVYLGGGDPDKCFYTPTTDFIATGTVKGRGNSSWLNEKQSYTLKLDEKAQLLDLDSNTDWALVANYEDKTLLRNQMASYMADEAGVPYVMEMRPVDLWLNGKFWGNYSLVEKIEVSKTRVDITGYNTALTNNNGQTPAADQLGYLLEFDAHVTESEAGNNDFSIIHNFNPDDMVTGGLYCPTDGAFFTPQIITDDKNGYGKTDTTVCPVDGTPLVPCLWTKHVSTFTTKVGGNSKNFTVSTYYNPINDTTFFPDDLVGGKYVIIHKPNTANLTGAYIDYIVQKLYTAEEAIKTKQYSQYSQYVDISALINWFMVENMADNTDDSFHSSVWLSIDVGGKFTMGPVWDFDRGFENTDYWVNPVTTLYNAGWFSDIFDSGNSGTNANVAAARTALKTAWAAYDAKMVGFNTELNKWTSIIDESQKLNFLKWPILGVRVARNPFYNTNPTATGAYTVNETYNDQLTFLSTWVYNRATQMNTMITAIK